jgi:hypothetical protein
LIFFRLDALIFDKSASLSSASLVSRTDIKMITRNARLDARKSDARRQSEGNRFDFIQEIGSSGQIDDHSRTVLCLRLEKRPEPVETFDSRLGIRKFIFTIQVMGRFDDIHRIRFLIGLYNDRRMEKKMNLQGRILFTCGNGRKNGG